ncbi:MAG: hypothetical protein LC768_02045 [Acidobacteria bacterium]|nr:hypothetical protein [Acidobacteriota bacterium]MCA1637113.1 hypothetical protein [Acidobacteriota bacterium]
MNKKTLFYAICLIIFSFGFADAQTESIVPILNLQVKGLMGGVENGKFVNAKTTVGKLSSETKYKIFEPYATSIVDMIFTKPVNSMDVCDDFYGFGEKDFAKTENSKGVAIGANASWNAMPRQPKKIALTDIKYKKATADALQTKGIFTKTIKLTQVFRIDLEGDGTEEVVITATSYPSGVYSSAKKNDYSFVLLRKVVNGKARNIIVTGDFITKKIDFGAPGEYEVSAIADLNGDGKMELVIYCQYYEGNWVETYEMKGGKLSSVKILDVACGV